MIYIPNIPILGRHGDGVMWPALNPADAKPILIGDLIQSACKTHLPSVNEINQGDIRPLQTPENYNVLGLVLDSLEPGPRSDSRIIVLDAGWWDLLEPLCSYVLMNLRDLSGVQDYGLHTGHALDFINSVKASHPSDIEKYLVAEATAG